MAASSSSSSHLIRNSSSQSWNYDVFLSFRGEDTRKTFVDHLYSALVQQGIHTYKDDETLPRGESIGPSLLKAIQESRIAVIVFSENYADSSWCLDELAYIMECMEKRGQIVLPVFYDVDPSEVRKQYMKHGKAFTKNELQNNKIETWRKALANAGNLSGWVPKDFANGHEAECIKDIVNTISTRLFPLFSNVNEDLVGMETRLQHLISHLEIGSGGVRIIGIWGVGGVGKTTLAYSAYMEVSRHFEANCLLENIREETNNHGLTRLQEKILSLVLKTKKELVKNEEEGKSLIKSRLCHKNVLIVLDDVDNLDQLEGLAGSHDWFGRGSRIIITTRDEHLLTRKADVIYSVSLLSHEEGMKLFRRHAYREDKAIEDYEMLSQDVVSYAGGLPLALKILGSFLYDKDKDQWMSALARLREIPNPRIMDKLKISYDGLQPDEKELFLDIACFMRGWPIDQAMMVLDACSFYPVIGVKVLTQKSLITVSDGVFDMHDLIEEMAHYIVKGEHTKQPETYSRIWQRDDLLDICDMDTQTENHKIEVIALPEYSSHPRLPHVVANMKKLRWISLDSYPANSLPKSFQPTKLGCLMLIRGLQKELWRGCKHLPNLKLLDLRDSSYLTRTPDLSGLPCLERLILKGCEELKEIHPSVGYHQKLVFLDMKRCSKLTMFPPIVSMRMLGTLKLSSCDQLKKFPDIRTNMHSLVKLRLNSTAIDIVPSSVGEYCTNLISLDLRECEKLKRIEGNFRLLKYLKELHLDGCLKLEKLADDFFDVESCLEVFSLCTMSQSQFTIKNILNCCFQEPVGMKFPNFPRSLRKLNLSSCDLVDGDIPYDFCELSNLQVLDLSDNYLITRLQSSLSKLQRHKFLNLSECFGLEELPDLPSSIAVLKADKCDRLVSIGDLSNYKWLCKVSLWREEKLIGCERVVHSMLQGNAVEDHFISATLPGVSKLGFYFADNRTYTLQLPQNWSNDFSGFLLCFGSINEDHVLIGIKQDETCIDSQPDHWEDFDKKPESNEHAMVGYISFGLLRHTSWWNSSHTKILFEFEGNNNPKVGLVPRKGKLCDSKERANGAIDCSEFWDEEVAGNNKTFTIKHDSVSSVVILWSHFHGLFD